MNIINIYKTIKDKSGKRLVFVVWLSWLILQVFFISADPDVNLSFSRDAFTDEGLYTTQVRNYINHDTFRVDESDCLIKTPLFSAYLYGPFSVFGTKSIVARLSVLLGFAFIVLWLGLQKNFAYETLMFIVLGLFQYHLFQYVHFSMAEMLCTGCALLGVYQLIAFSMRQKTRSLLWAACWLAIAALLKIQFVYLIGLLPIGMLLTSIFNRKFNNIRNWKWPVILVLALLLAFWGLFWWGWYVPYKSTMDYVMQNQTSGRFPHLNELRGLCWFNIQTYFLNKYTFPLTLLFITCFTGGLFLVFKVRDRLFSLGFWMIAAWILLETHKLGMNYLPSRYLVSCWAAMALLCAWVLVFGSKLVLKSELKVIYKFGIATMLLPMAFLIINNGTNVYHLWKIRSYTLQNINKYINNRLQKGDVVLGPWAPNLCWSEKAYTATIWKDYFNDKDILAHYHPRLIISELDEKESDKAYSTQGINLQELADSTQSFHISQWSIRLYWLKAH